MQKKINESTPSTMSTSMYGIATIASAPNDRLPDDPAWIAGRESALGNVARDDAAGADHGARSDADPGKYQRATTDPDIRANLDRLAELLLPAQLVVERVQRRKNLHTGT